jgi:hypothetical protein
MEDKMTKDEAEFERKTSVALQTRRFCPLIKGDCRQQCECFYDGYVYESHTSSEVFTFKKARCTCFFLVGEID